MKTALCTAQVYRGVVTLTIRPKTAEAATVVVGAVSGQDVQLYECASQDEAHALIDAALLLTNLPARLGGDARAVVCGTDPQL